MEKKIKVLDKTFKEYLPYEEIKTAIDSVAARLNNDYKDCGEVPILLCVLNGAIMFTSELMKRLDFDIELVSIKLSSYSGTASTGSIRQPLGLTSDVCGRRVIVVEDIIDSGTTMEELKRILRDKGATDVRLCTMLFKPEAFKRDYTIDYIGKEIPNDFIVGFGLDYNEIGRNYRDIFIIDKSMKYYILFGPPGAGKGTQASAMVEKFNLCHISTGDLLRAEMRAGTELGKQARALIEAGKLVPDEVVENMIENQFNTVTGVDGFLLDGFPRTMPQAEALDAILAKRGEEVTGVISLMISEDVIRQRIRHRAAIEGRADDAKEETITNRIATYHAQTEPLIGYYEKQGKYHEIPGDIGIENVRAAIFKTVESL